MIDNLIVSFFPFVSAFAFLLFILCGIVQTGNCREFIFLGNLHSKPYE